MTQSKFLSNAPDCLIARYESGGPGKTILGKLLTDPDMNRAWYELNRKIQRKAGAQEAAWLELWQRIQWATMQSKKKHRTRSEREKALAQIAKMSGKLADLIANQLTYLNDYRLNPNDVALIIGDPLRHEHSRPDTGDRVLSSWGYFPDDLHELSRTATVLASKSKASKQGASRMSLTYSQRVFARDLQEFVLERYEAPLHGTVAKVTSVTFDSAFTKDQVVNLGVPITYKKNRR